MFQKFKALSKINYLKLFANCQIVKGSNRSIICDLQREKYIFIPNTLSSLFDNNGLIDIKLIENQLDEDDVIIFYDYLRLLEEHEFVFPCTKNESKKFPLLNLEFDYPALISNSIIDFDKNSTHELYYIISNFFIPANCRYIQIRCFDEVDIDFLNKIITEVNNSFIKAIDLIIKDSNLFTHKEISNWTNKNRKIRCITIYSSKENKVIQEENYGFSTVVTIKQNISSEIHCGFIHYNNFVINTDSFTESHSYNTCLNRKLSIDKDGNIKNCPSMKENFGNIKNSTFQEVYNHPDFKKYWNINKDQIEVCRDCEFRHICTDCRVYIENPEDQYSKPLKCGYNPYTNIWEEWSTNPLKQKAIEYYGMQDLVKKDD